MFSSRRKLAIGVAGVALLVPLLTAAGRALPGDAKLPSAEGRIERLVQQLGDQDYAVRQHAQDELAKLGFIAYEALVAASKHTDLEIATRAKYLLRVLRSKWATDRDPPRVKELLDGYDLRNPEDRMQRIRQLASLSNLAGVPALCRLLRFESSAVLSNYTAAAILNNRPPDAAAQARLHKLLRENLAGCRRTGAAWLMAYVQLAEEPGKALDAWMRLAEAERAVLERSPSQSSPAVAAPLVYVLAETQARLGDAAQSDQTARRARELAPGSDSPRLQARLEAAVGLKRRGRFDWAQAEYRQVIASGHALAAFYGNRELSEMLHDRGDNELAAKTCRKALEALQQRDTQWGDLAEEPRQARARMDYFFACHYAEKGDRTLQAQSLQRALQAEPGEVDTLIASYHLPGPSPEFRKQIVAAIQRQAEVIRRKIAESPDDPEPYNQFAWLIGNTEGNLKEALKFSQKSLELSPNTGSYLDTLAHVHFTTGDLEAAVKHQAKAAELEPHSGLIARKLQVFRAALEAKRKPEQPGKTLEKSQR